MPLLKWETIKIKKLEKQHQEIIGQIEKETEDLIARCAIIAKLSKEADLIEETIDSMSKGYGIKIEATS